MMTPRLPFAFSVLAAVILLNVANSAVAQTVGSEEYEAPEDTLPGESGVAPPTTEPDGAGVHGSETRPGAAAPAELSDGDRSASVRLHHGSDDHTQFSDHPVVLHAVRPPGPLQPDSHRQTISSWNAVTDDDGVAKFTDLPDNLRRHGLQLQASTTFGGLSFDSELIVPTDEAVDIDLTVFDRTHELPPIRLSKKRVLISPWEEYLVFDQFWTLQIDGEHAFDVSASSDSFVERGLPLRLPFAAEGISVAGPGSHEIINNIVYWDGVLQPNRDITIQIRFSKSVRTSSFVFDQQMDYPVDEIELLAPIDTQFERISRLDDLTLRAPGFEVGTDPAAVGLPSTRDYLIAHGHSVDADESYTFRVDGLPFSRPLGGWISLFGGLLAFLFIIYYGRREYRNFHDSRSRREILDALHRRRDAVVDELAEIERALGQTDDPDETFELEEEQILLRQRLALILGKIDDLDSEDPSSSEAA